MQEDFNDDYGHGTSIYSIIKKQCEDLHCESPQCEQVKIFVIKLISEKKESYKIESDLLYLALEYIEQHINCKRINISLGLKTVENIHNLECICDKILKNEVLFFLPLIMMGRFLIPLVYRV